MKKITLLVILSLFTIITFAQSTTRIIIESTINNDNSNNSGAYRMTCERGPGGWVENCYVIGIYCTNGGLSVAITVKNCVGKIGDSPNIGTKPTPKLLDLNIGVIKNKKNIGIINLQKYKNAYYEISNDIVYSEIDKIVVIKSGVYKVTNSKLHVLIHKE